MLALKTIWYSSVIAFTTLAMAPAKSGLLTFEEFPRDTVLPIAAYRSIGVAAHSVRIAEKGFGGVDGAASGTKSGMPNGSTSIDGTSAVTIAARYGISPIQYGPNAVGVADLVFLVPNTDTPATINQFSLFMGFDQINWPERNAFTIQGYDLLSREVFSYTSPSLTAAGGLFQAFVVSGVNRLRITHSDYVSFDDLSFTLTELPPVPEIDAAGLGAVGALVTGVLSVMERRRSRLSVRVAKAA